MPARCLPSLSLPYTSGHLTWPLESCFSEMDLASKLTIFALQRIDKTLEATVDRRLVGAYFQFPSFIRQILISHNWCRLWETDHRHLQIYTMAFESTSDGIGSHSTRWEQPFMPKTPINGEKLQADVRGQTRAPSGNYLVGCSMKEEKTAKLPPPGDWKLSFQICNKFYLLTTWNHPFKGKGRTFWGTVCPSMSK